MDDFWYDPVPGFEMPSSYVICQLCNGLGHTAIDCLSCYEPYDPVHTDPSFSVSDWLYPEQNESLDSNDSSSVIEEPLTDDDDDVNESSPSLFPTTTNWYIEDLLDQLSILQKLPSQSLKNYFSEAKSISYALARAGSPISEIELMNFLVDGLDSVYEKFVRYYFFRLPKISLDFLYDHLLDTEKEQPSRPFMGSSSVILDSVADNASPKSTSSVQGRNIGMDNLGMPKVAKASKLSQAQSYMPAPSTTKMDSQEVMDYEEDEYYTLYSPKEWQYMPWYDHLYMMLLFNINWLLSVFPIGIIFVLLKLHLRTSDWLEGGYWTNNRLGNRLGDNVDW